MANKYSAVYPSDEYGYQKDNPRHQESYWEGRVDPRAGFPATDKGMAFTNNYYNVIDRTIAANHHARVTAPNAPNNAGCGISGQKK